MVGDLKAIRRDAIRLLARREHTLSELRRKLRARGHGEGAVDAVIASLEEEGLASDVRFTETFIASRIMRGHGPLRIRRELRERGVCDAVIEVELAADPRDWRLLAEDARCKRFGPERPKELRARARQARFLEYRGFTAEQIRRVLEDSERD